MVAVAETKTLRGVTWQGFDEMVLRGKIAAVLRGEGNDTESMIGWNTTLLL